MESRRCSMDSGCLQPPICKYRLAWFSSAAVSGFVTSYQCTLNLLLFGCLHLQRGARCCYPAASSGLLRFKASLAAAPCILAGIVCCLAQLLHQLLLLLLADTAGHDQFPVMPVYTHMPVVF
eukprot:GHRR01006741.1.p1 GENE.GHRR01006741.1~~GHRR01006741.1.p1  ORF type:complete len:122 (-),score=24.98 GHRR01006741.1:1349-1714(-)